MEKEIVQLNVREINSAETLAKTFTEEMDKAFKTVLAEIGRSDVSVELRNLESELARVVKVYTQLSCEVTAKDACMKFGFYLIENEIDNANELEAEFTKFFSKNA